MGGLQSAKKPGNGVIHYNNLQLGSFMQAIRLNLLFIILLLTSCQPALMIGTPLGDQPLTDGVYTGSFRNGPNSAVVKVTIVDSRIEDVELVRHFSSWKGGKANKVIPQRIKAQQSTRVDAVTGATNSSIVIMNAAQKAIEKAYQKRE